MNRHGSKKLTGRNRGRGKSRIVQVVLYEGEPAHDAIAEKIETMLANGEAKSLANATYKLVEFAVKELAKRDGMIEDDENQLLEITQDIRREVANIQSRLSQLQSLGSSVPNFDMAGLEEVSGKMTQFLGGFGDDD